MSACVICGQPTHARTQRDDRGRPAHLGCTGLYTSSVAESVDDDHPVTGPACSTAGCGSYLLTPEALESGQCRPCRDRSARGRPVVRLLQHQRDRPLPPPLRPSITDWLAADGARCSGCDTGLLARESIATGVCQQCRCGGVWPIVGPNQALSGPVADEQRLAGMTAQPDSPAKRYGSAIIAGSERDTVTRRAGALRATPTAGRSLPGHPRGVRR